MSLIPSRIKTMVDNELSVHTHIGYSENGTSETTKLARTAVSVLGGWTAPTAANPYSPQNVSAGDSAECTAGGTFTHYATFSAATGTEAATRLTGWILGTAPDPAIITGGKLSHAAGAIKPLSTTASGIA